MRVRIIKLKEDLYLLQGKPADYANWEGLGLTMSFFGKVVNSTFWNPPDYQIQYCSYESKRAASKALLRYAASRKLKLIQGAELLEKGEYEIVFETKI